MNLIRKIGLRLAGENNSGLKSYSQCGEDCLIWFLSRAVGLSLPSYLDIGAFDPYQINNTAMLYELGCRGINIEPNNSRYKGFIRERKEDINLNIAISEHSGTGTFFEMSLPTLSTIIENEALRLEASGIAEIKSRTQIPLLTMPDIITNYCDGKFPDILCIDTEGLEDLILGQLAKMESHPAIVCAETVEFAGEKFGRKKTEILNLMSELNYSVYADTFINTIFLKNSFWK